MNGAMRTTLDDLRSDDRARQNRAFIQVLQATERPVDWAYEACGRSIGRRARPDEKHLY